VVEVSSLSVVVGYDDSAVQAGVAKTSQAVSGLGATMGSIFSGIGLAAGERIFDTITSGFKAGADAAIGFNSNLEQSTIAFTSMLGSAEKAQAFLADMKQFAATTPFEFPDLLQASKQMMAFGFAAQDVRPLLTAVGSAASAMGTGRVGVDAITKALGQMRAATVVQAGELNQLTEQGVPAFQILADAMGISTGEVKKLASEGKIASDVFINAFQVWAKSNYGDMMAKQALTFEGAMSNIKDSLTFAVADAFRPFFEVISAGAVQLGEFVQSETFTAWAKTVADTTRDAFRQIGDAVRTVQQVLAGDWAPSDKIEPFALAVGNAAVMLRDTFGPAISAAARFVTGTLIPAVQQFAAPIAAFVAGFTGAVAAVSAAGAAIALVTGILGALLTPLGAVAIAVGLLAAAWTTDFLGIQEATSAFMAAVGPIFQQLVVIVQTALTGDIGTAFAQFLALVQSIGAQLLPLLAQWGQAFVAWVVETIPPMLAAAADLGAQLLAWIASQVPIWTAGLLAWTTEWVNWLVVAAPLILTAAAAFITPLIAWIAQQVPVLVAALLAWGQEFVAWVAPQIGPLLVALGALALALLDWIIAQVPGITAKLVEWGLLYAAWVSTTAIPELLKALPGILTTIAGWIGTAAVEIGTRVLALGLALAQGIYDGFVNAWKTIGPKIMESIKSVFTMPSFGGGGAQTLSYGSTASGSGTHAAPYLPLVNQVSRETGVPADVLAALIDTEGSGQGSTSPAGARGLMQVMPNYVHAGEDPFDPLTSIRQGARAITEKYNAVGGDWNAAAGAYFGYGTDAGGMTTGVYQNRFRQNRANYQNQPAASPMDMQKIPLGRPPGAPATRPAGRC
jgi:tape measure domain-containing protein